MREYWNCWRFNVWRNRRFLITREYRYYYCNLWCFLTDQRYCKGIQDGTD